MAHTAHGQILRIITACQVIAGYEMLHPLSELRTARRGDGTRCLPGPPRGLDHLRLNDVSRVPTRHLPIPRDVMRAGRRDKAARRCQHADLSPARVA